METGNEDRLYRLDRLVLDFLRTRGYNEVADDFAREKNIDESQPYEMEKSLFDMWSEDLLANKVKRRTLQGDASAIQQTQTTGVVDQLYTSIAGMHISPQPRIDQDNAHAMHSEIRTSPADSAMQIEDAVEAELFL